jgi:hypothetical protein
MERYGHNVCNICGQVIDHTNQFEGFRLNSKVGYGSVYDGEILELHVCSDCMDRLIDTCKVHPIKNHESERNYPYMGDEPSRGGVLWI